MVFALLSSALFGFSVAIPFGPVSLICVQRSLLNGTRHGIVSGLGAATAHGAFAMLATAGAGFAATYLAEWQMPIHLVSSAVLIALGLRTAIRKIVTSHSASSPGTGTAYATAFLLAISNPMTILPYLALASTFAAGNNPFAINSFWANGPWMAFGVILGTSSWYSVLCGGATLLRSRLGQNVMNRLNLAAGGALIGLGTWLGFGTFVNIG